MKKSRILVLSMVLSPVFVLSQQTPAHKTDTTKEKPLVATSFRIVRFSDMDQRKIYHWGNGERSTASGREAGEHLSGFVKLVGDDSAVVVEKPVK